MDAYQDQQPADDPIVETELPRRKRGPLLITLGLATLSLSLTAGIVWLGITHFSFDARDDEARFGSRKTIRVAEVQDSSSRWGQAEDYRALPATFADWVRTDFIGGENVAKGIARLRTRLPDADLALHDLDHSRHSCAAAIYERGDEVLMIVVDRGGHPLPDDLTTATRTTLGGLDFILMGRRGEANINLLAVFDDDVTLAVIGRAEPDTVARFVRRANLSVLGVRG